MVTSRLRSNNQIFTCMPSQRTQENWAVTSYFILTLYRHRVSRGLLSLDMKNQSSGILAQYEPGKTRSSVLNSGGLLIFLILAREYEFVVQSCSLVTGLRPVRCQTYQLEDLARHWTNSPGFVGVQCLISLQLPPHTNHSKQLAFRAFRVSLHAWTFAQIHNKEKDLFCAKKILLRRIFEEVMSLTILVQSLQLPQFCRTKLSVKSSVFKLSSSLFSGLFRASGRKFVARGRSACFYANFWWHTAQLFFMRDSQCFTSIVEFLHFLTKK